jgi:hypothetical protein
MAEIVLFDPGDSAPVELDWSDGLGGVANLVTVTHTLPSPLVKLGETHTGTLSYVGVSGAVHGKRYMVEAAATLSTTNPDGSAQILNRQFVLMGWNS